MGKADYILYTHHLASCLVRRNVLDANSAEVWPAKRRLTFKQPRPPAFPPVGGPTAIRAKKGPKPTGPNIQARADLAYALGPEGTWRVNGHEMRPESEEAKPRLTCVKCNRTTVWALKHVMYQQACAGFAMQNVSPRGVTWRTRLRISPWTKAS
eukprot:4112151-Amphidinium_carterae.1